jgi:hypothetical protein
VQDAFLMHNSTGRTLIFIFFFFIYRPFVNAQTADYRTIFGDDWKKAEQYEHENRNWIEPVLVNNQLSYPVAVSIIFPELVRYSALRDKIEISMLKTLYVNLGEDYADFSIGVFQMKPSFAETICTEAPSVVSSGLAGTFPEKADFSDIKSFRKTLVRDLENPQRQLDYLVAFIKICQSKFRMENFQDSTRVKFLATAYNYGIDHSQAEIENMTGRRFFNTRLIKTENYPYAQVALYWYKHFLPEK